MAARQKAPKKQSGKRSTDDEATIRQRKVYRRRVINTMAMTAGFVTQTTHVEVAPTAPPGTRQNKKQAKTPRIVAKHQLTPHVVNNARNRNARISGLTIGDSWKLAAGMGR